MSIKPLFVAKFQSADRVGERCGGCCVGHRNRPVLATTSLATSQGVLGLEDLRGAFADDDAGRHGVSGGDAGHDRPVSDTEAVDSIDFQLAIDHRHGVSAHLGGAGLMPVAHGGIADEALKPGGRQVWRGAG